MIKFIFTIWCFPQNLIGYIMYLFYKKCPQEVINNRIVVYWGKNKNGCSMGRYLFIPDDTNVEQDQVFSTKNFIVHEYGHSIQSLIFGPFWFLIFGFESMIWCALWQKINNYRVKKCQTPLLYNTFYPEKNANYFGEKFFKHKGIYW